MNNMLPDLFIPKSEKEENYIAHNTTINCHSIQEICDLKSLSYTDVKNLFLQIKNYFLEHGKLPNNDFLYREVMRLYIQQLNKLPSDASIISPNDITITFDRIYGNEKLKNELMDIVDLFKYETNILNSKSSLSICSEEQSNLDSLTDYCKGFILYGEAGLGKTMFAKAIAKQCDIPFVSISGAFFKQSRLGGGKKAARDLFDILRKAAPVVLFIDEIDNIGQRSQTAASYDDEIITQLLTEIDGINSNNNKNPIMIIGATNHINKLDSALIRPGRFDRILKVEMPSLDDLRTIIVNVASEYKNLVKLDENDYNNLTVKIFESGKGTGAFVANLFKQAYMKYRIHLMRNSNDKANINGKHKANDQLFIIDNVLLNSLLDDYLLVSHDLLD